jgi:hypothetical protein
MSVNCGWCGQRGHNKLGCQERKKQARENPDSYLASTIQMEEEERARRVAKRACTYCSKQGHNRAGCKSLKADKADVLQKNIEYRDAFAKALSKAGAGTGALIELGDGSHSDRWDRSTMYMVTDVVWENINFLPLAYEGSISGTYSLLNHNIFKMRPVCSMGYEAEPTDPWASNWKKPSPTDIKWVALSDIANLLPEELFSNSVNLSVNPPSERENNPQSKMISPVVGVTFDQPDKCYSLIPESIKSYFNFDPKGKKDSWNSRQVAEDSWVWNGVKRLQLSDE